MTNSQKVIWTIGHSTRPLALFVELLKASGIEKLMDVRRYPGSGRFPCYNKEHLEISLPEHQIDYLHLEELGGRRKANKNSRNSAWRHASFRGYADYMETEAFKEAAEELQKVALHQKTAYMCSEAVWWSCHRSLISDYLKIMGWKVTHIMGPEKSMEHPYTKPARIVDGKLSYEQE